MGECHGSLKSGVYYLKVPYDWKSIYQVYMNAKQGKSKEIYTEKSTGFM